MTVFYKTSADVGAPVLSGQNGALVNSSNTGVLDWFLTTICGLTKTFTGTNRGIWTMPNGDLLRFYHDSAVSGSATLCHVRGMESATGIDTFADLYPTVAQQADNVATIGVSSTANSTARSWWALLDNVNCCFYLFIDGANNPPGLGLNGGFYYIGATSELATDNYGSLIFTRNTSVAGVSSVILFSQVGNAPLATIHWKRTRDGSIKSSLGSLGPNNGTSLTAVLNGPTAPHPDSADYRFENMYAMDGYTTTTTAGVGYEPKRMYFPNLYVGLHVASGYTGLTIGQQITSGGKTYAFFPCGTATGGNGGVFLLIDGSWTKPT